MKILQVLILTFLCSVLNTNFLFGVQATPEPIKIIQSDGSEITIYLRGDEFFSYRTSLDGYLIKENNSGIFEYASMNGKGETNITGVRVNNIEKRSFSEKRFLTSLAKAPNIKPLILANQALRIKSKIASANNAFPRVGSPKSLVILVNFSDKSFVVPNPQQSFYNLLNQKGYAGNGGTGSAKDYFKESSNGVFTPEFVVVGPFTLPQNMEYYGKNKSNGDDQNPLQMVIDACKLADDAGLDFTQFDTDNNGILDNVFIYYAGNNEAESGSTNTIWPHRWSLSNTNSKFDNKIVYDYACTSEFRGSGSFMCGIGTFCHEFGHVLGLVDYYATNGANHHTVYVWNIMDYGAYLNQGRTPPTYSAYDRFYLNWLVPIELKNPTSIELTPLITSNKAYLISKTGNHNLNGGNPNPLEFFMLENRQTNIGFDKYLPNSGMLITRINYNSNSWQNNSPNNDVNVMGFDIIEADGIATTASLGGDMFPGSLNKTSYTPISRDGTIINKPLTFIKKETNGNVSFRFMGGGNVPTITCVSNFYEYSTVQGTPSAIQLIKVHGKKLTTDLNIAFSEKNHYEMRKANEPGNTWYKSISLKPNPIDSIVDTTLIHVRYNPTVPSYGALHSDIISFTSSEAESVLLDVNGRSTRPIYVVKPNTLPASEVTLGGFKANWSNVFDASGYYLTLYSIAEGASEFKETFRNGLTPSLGWTINADSETTSKTYSGDSIPAIWLKITGEFIQTELYNVAAVGLSFYIKSLLAENSVLLVEGWNGSQWVVIDNIISTINTSATKNYTFTIDKNYIRFRFKYTQMSGQLAIDDISIKLSKEVEFIVNNKWVDTNSYLADNLVSNREYFYKVKASDRTLTEDKKLILYENITEYSDLMLVKTLEDTNKKILRVEKIESDGTVFVFIPSYNDNLYIYNFAGQLIKIITPKSLKINLSDYLSKKQPYILVSGGKSAKIFM